MAWSETLYEIQHFYNAFDLDNRVKKTENKFPIVAKKNSENKPENITIENLTEGTIWFIKED